MKKNYVFVFALMCMFTVKSSAQESIIGDVNYGTLEKYIQAAKDYYPKRKMQAGNTEVAKIAVTNATLSYLDIFSASYFYRPNDQQAISQPGATTNPYIVNGIQYGITLNLGTFLQKPFMVKRAKAELKIAKWALEDYEIELVLDVKRKYYAYIQALGELKIRTQIAQENRVVADNAGKRFGKGEVSLDDYNNSRRILADANSSQITTEVAYLTAKDDLEAIIGAKLSDIK